MRLNPRPFQEQLVPRGSAQTFELPIGPLDVEVGAGVGWFAVSRCRRFPERNLIAIEQTREKFGKLERRAQNAQLPNLFPIHGNGISWITHHLGSHTVDGFYLLYPNPYPRHRRWHRTPFMQKLLQCLKPNGGLVLATNDAEYAGEAKLLLSDSLVLDTETWLSDPEKARTHFEKKYLLRGETCFNLVFKKETFPIHRGTRSFGEFEPLDFPRSE